MASPAPALVTLKAQLLKAYPSMRSADIGIMADAAHIAGGTSDHIGGNAIDIPVAGGPGAGAAHLALGLALLADGRAHYLIYDRTFYHAGRAPAAYTGSSPHTAHAHLSIDPTKRADDSPWTFGKEEEAVTVKVLDGAPGRVWRFRKGDDYRYRSDSTGAEALLNAGYDLDGPAFDLHGTIPVHSLLVHGKGHLSIDGAEIAVLVADGATDEGIIGHASTTGAPVWRKEKNGYHLFTLDRNEAPTWRDEEAAFYTGTVTVSTDEVQAEAALDAFKDKVAAIGRELVTLAG